MRSLVWFRSDLRVEDNTALYRAASVSTRGVIGLFLISPAQWTAHDWAACRVDLLRRTLGEVSASLGALNIPLLIAAADRFDDAPAAVMRVMKKHACDALHYNIEYEVNESRRDDAVKRAAAKAGAAVFDHHDQVVCPPGSIRTGSGTYYTVFTPFKKAWLKRIEETGGVRACPRPKKQEALGIAPDPVPRSAAWFQSATEEQRWPAGERHARRTLDEFAGCRINRYADDRDAPAADGTSTLSPHLAVGAISPRQCVLAAWEGGHRAFDRLPRGRAVWISEVIWREFYRHILVGFPRVCMHRPFRLETERVNWRDDPEAFRAWSEGRTGFPIVDAGMRQLRRVGWMHNRLRMISAMFLAKHLLIDWRRGERFFMQHLVDGDLASNNGGWQWSASTGTDAAPYFRIFSPLSQSKAYDPDGTFIRRFVPELADADAREIHDPPALMRARLGYPMPIVDHAEARARAIKAFEAIK
ncbi:MAG: deoxyribodipyrimidine photo-lyase [Phycisphaerales bacterium]